MAEVKKTKLLPPYLVIGAMLIMFGLDRYLPIIEWQYTRSLAYVLMPGAFLCILYCAYIFHKHDTEIKPLEESSYLILNWPYTISRNPIYLCMAIFLIAWCLWLESLSCLIVVVVFVLWIHFRFVLQEEKMLEARFGENYLAYKKRVRRWL